MQFKKKIIINISIILFKKKKQIYDVMSQYGIIETNNVNAKHVFLIIRLCIQGHYYVCNTDISSKLFYVIINQGRILTFSKKFCHELC